MSGKRLNPFQSFINKATKVEEPQNVTAPPDPTSDLPENWVHYIDDESGYPYMYNTVTGEARWLSEVEYQQQADAVVVVEGPWEKLYDEDGNAYYYNRDTGQSEWEIPAEEWMSYGLQTLENQPQEYYDQLGLDPAVGSQLTAKLSSMNLLEEALGESIGSERVVSFDESGSENNRSMKRVQSLKSVRSARSFGLHSSVKASSAEILAEQVSDQIADNAETNNSLRPKSLKTQLSFVISSKNMRVDSALKPKSPIKKQSKSGFEMLKEGSKPLRKGKDEKGNVWIEYQTADEGPIFYAIAGAVGGQWKQPDQFVVIQGSEDLDVAPEFNPKKDEVTTPSETSLEVVDYFSVDKDEVLKLQTPSMKKIDTSISNSPLLRDGIASPQAKSSATPSVPISGKKLPFSDNNATADAASTPTTVKLPEIKLVENSKPPTANSPRPVDTAKVAVLPSQTSTTLPPSSAELRIQSIKAEAALELERLRKRLETVKQEAKNNVPLRSSLISTASNLPISSNISTTPEVPTPTLPTPVAIASEESRSTAAATTTAAAATNHDDRGVLEAVLAPMPVVAPHSSADLGAVTTSSEVNVNVVSEAPKDATSNPAQAFTPEPSKSKPADEQVPTAVPAASLSDTQPSLSLTLPSPVSITPTAKAEKEREKVFSKSPSVNKRDDENNIPWDDLLVRAHLLRTTLRWECFYDIQTKLKFYKRRSDGFLQKDKPVDFDDILLSSAALYGTSTPTTGPTKEMHVSFATVAEEPKKPQSSISASSFLTGMDLTQAETPSHGEDGKTPPADVILLAPELKTTEEDISEVVPDQADSIQLTSMAKELAFVDRNASRAIRAIYEEKSRLEQQDADLLVHRLQRVAERRLKSEESNKLRRTTRHLAGMDTDDVKRLQARSRQLLERCYQIQEFIEASPIEHAMNEEQLLRAALQQREHLSMPLDFKHDRPLYHTMPSETLFPSSSSLKEYWFDRSHQAQRMGWMRLRHFSSASETVYYHTNSRTVQLGEPFDVYIRREVRDMKPEKWGDYEIKVSVNQSVLENSGIELWEDSKGGYVFRCPLRQSYSSNGRFDPISFSAKTGKAMLNSGQRSMEQPRKANADLVDSSNRVTLQTLRRNPSIWQQLGLRKDVVADTVQRFFMTTGAFGDTMSSKNMTDNDQDGSDLVPQSSSSPFRLPSYDSSGVSGNQQSQNVRLQAAMNYLKDEMYKLGTLDDTLLSIEQKRIQERPNFTTTTVINDNKVVRKIDSFSILEEAFSIAQQQYDPAVIRASEEETWRYERNEEEDVNVSSSANFSTGTNTFPLSMIDTNEEENGTEDSELDAGGNDLLAMVNALRFEKRFDTDATQRYQQVLITIYQDPENPLHYLDLLEFMLNQGLHKAALGILKYAVQIMQESENYSPGKYELALAQILTGKLGSKAQNTFESYSQILNLIDRFPDKPLILTHAAIYFTKICHLDWAELLYMGALVVNPVHELTLVKHAHQVYLQGDLKQACRLLQRNGLENANGLWSRKSRLEAMWLQELLSAEDEALIIGHKALITIASRDRVQALALLSLGSIYQRQRRDKLTYDYYQRSWQLDRDNGMTSLLFATAQTVQFMHNQVSHGVTGKPEESTGKTNVSNATVKSAVELVDDLMMSTQRKTDGPPLQSSSTRPRSASATGRVSSSTNRPKSANATSRAKATNSLKGSTNGGTLLTVSSSLTQLPAHKVAAAAAAVVESVQPVLSAQQNAAWKQNADALYRRGLLLMPYASYHWLALLSYADFILGAMGDVHRAVQYYEDAVKVSFTTQIWPIVALGGVFQYVLNDYEAARRLYCRALRSRHPTPSMTNAPKSSAKHSQDEETEKGERRSVGGNFLLSFQQFLRRKPRAVPSTSHLTSTSLSAAGKKTKQQQHQDYQHAYHHYLPSVDEDHDADPMEESVSVGENADGERRETRRKKTGASIVFNRSELSAPLSMIRTSVTGGSDTQDDDFYAPPSPFSSSAASNPQQPGIHYQTQHQRRSQDTLNTVVQEKECQVLYTAIAYLLWDLGEAGHAQRYALAAVHLNPNYSPALRCLGLLIYFYAQDRRLAFRYLTAAAEVATSSVSSSSAGPPATSSAAPTAHHLHHNLAALRSFAIVKAMKSQYDQAIVLLERVLQTNATCGFAHRTLGLWWYQCKHQPEKALQHLHTAWEVSGHRDLDSLRWKAQILMDLQAFKEARVCLLECCRLAPSDALSFANLAMCVYLLSIVKHPENLRPDHTNTAKRPSTSTGVRVFSIEELTTLAHSRDPFLLLETALSLKAAGVQTSYAQFAASSTASASTTDHHRHSKHAGRPPLPARGLDTGGTVDSSTAADDEDDVSFPVLNEERMGTSSILAYIHYQRGCLDLLLTPHRLGGRSDGFGDFDDDHQYFVTGEQPSSSTNRPSLTRAKAAFTAAAVHSQLCAQSQIYPMALFRLGYIAECEGDYLAAERWYTEAVQAPNLHPLSLLPLLDNIAQNLARAKDRLQDLKRPYQRNGPGRRKKRSKRSALVDSSATFSDFAAAMDKSNQPIPSQKKKTSKKALGDSKVPEGMEWMDRNAQQAKAFFSGSFFLAASKEASMAAAAKKAKSEDDSAGEGENVDNDDGDDDEEDEDIGGPEELKLLNDVPVGAQNVAMAQAFKCVMMHQRVQENALLCKYNMAKQLKDLRWQFPKWKRENSLRSVHSSLHHQEIIHSFVYVDHDWLERNLYASAKLEDWAGLFKSFAK